MTRATAAAAIDAANDKLARQADMMRQDMDAARDCGEMGECVRKIMVWDDGRGRGGCGDDGTSPDPSRPRRSVRRGYIHCARDGGGNASVWAAPSRGVGILEGCFQDMVGAARPPTACPTTTGAPSGSGITPTGCARRERPQ